MTHSSSTGLRVGGDGVNVRSRRHPTRFTEGSRWVACRRPVAGAYRLSCMCLSSQNGIYGTEYGLRPQPPQPEPRKPRMFAVWHIRCGTRAIVICISHTSGLNPDAGRHTHLYAERTYELRQRHVLLYRKIKPYRRDIHIVKDLTNSHKVWCARLCGASSIVKRFA